MNPDFEPAIMYLGNIAKAQGKDIVARQYYESLITKNLKYFEAYVELSKLLTDKDIYSARGLLRKCLTLSPGYIPAITALADTYRKTDPGIAKQYDDLANTIEQTK
jgi:tetratricopeptide (TPR) repeat protein